MKKKLLSLLGRLYASPAQQRATGEFFHKLSLGSILGSGWIMFSDIPWTPDNIVIAIYLLLLGAGLYFYGRSFF